MNPKTSPNLFTIISKKDSIVSSSSSADYVKKGIIVIYEHQEESNKDDSSVITEDYHVSSQKAVFSLTNDRNYVLKGIRNTFKRVTKYKAVFSNVKEDGTLSEISTVPKGLLGEILKGIADIESDFANEKIPMMFQGPNVGERNKNIIIADSYNIAWIKPPFTHTISTTSGKEFKIEIHSFYLFQCEQ